MGFFDDLIKDLTEVAVSVGQASNELKGLKSDVLSSFDGVKTDAKKLIETAKGNEIDTPVEAKSGDDEEEEEEKLAA